MATAELDIIKQQSQNLLPNQKVELIKFLTESLTAQKNQSEPKHLVYGEFRNCSGKMSTEEDFQIAEWHPTEAELNGD
jgi:hypothetical protein